MELRSLDWFLVFICFYFRFALTIAPSPCINWCDINPDNGFCRGCYRTLPEIADWSKLSNSNKLEVLEKLQARKPQVIQ
ncbi:DUF1289 domain-containing protein [Polynucleobacter sp. AP-Elch-400A-B2]|uniref:DUF1289 domain-containing protein n=1 Tax=Polynucleobacter sp. AP-Elch-400A-B2 TaxID=2576930 RepID=UPI00203E1407|nr:DUF1289 domain-containing protein [Polynucleobacter sp. AP-Elch-400A-B2]